MQILSQCHYVHQHAKTIPSQNEPEPLQTQAGDYVPHSGMAGVILKLITI